MAKTYTPKPADVHAANLSVLKDRLKSGNLSGAYLFYGDEEYTKNFYYNEFLKFCGNRQLNVRTFFDSDFSLPDFINACQTSASAAMSLFNIAPQDENPESNVFRLVRLASVSFDKLSKTDEKYFLSQIEDPDDGVIIVFYLYAGENEKIAKGLYKKIADAALTINFRHEANGSNMLLSWILRHFSKAGVNADRHIISYFNNYVGNDMTTLKNEIDNCIEYLRYEGRDTLTEEDIRFICKQSVSAQIFDISSQALAGNYTAAMSAYKVFRLSGEKELIVFGTLAKAVSDLCTVDKLSESGMPLAEIVKTTGLRDFVVRNYQNLIAKRKKDGGISYPAYASEVILKYDTLLKSSRTDGYELLEELIFKLAAGNRI